jgi:hypothetical protein
MGCGALADHPDPKTPHLCSSVDRAGAVSEAARDHFQLVAVGAEKVDLAPATDVIDLAGAMSRRVGPMVQPPLADAAEDSVEVRHAGQKRTALWSDRARAVGEVERDPVVEFHHVEMAEADWRRSAEHLSQEPGGLCLVRQPDDRVV